MYNGKYTKSITIAIEPKMYAEIKKLTDKEERSINEWMRDMIEVSLSVFDTEYNEFSHNASKE